MKNIDFNSKFIEETIFKCEQALLWEKSRIRKAGLLYVIAELKNFIGFGDKENLYTNIKTRIQI